MQQPNALTWSTQKKYFVPKKYLILNQKKQFSTLEENIFYASLNKVFKLRKPKFIFLIITRIAKVYYTSLKKYFLILLKKRWSPSFQVYFEYVSVIYFFSYFIISFIYSTNFCFSPSWKFFYQSRPYCCFLLLKKWVKSFYKSLLRN